MSKYKSGGEVVTVKEVITEPKRRTQVMSKPLGVSMGAKEI